MLAAEAIWLSAALESIDASETDAGFSIDARGKSSKK
jgi:hypothetical protein